MKWGEWELRQFQRANEPRTHQIAAEAAFSMEKLKGIKEIRSFTNLTNAQNYPVLFSFNICITF